MNQRLKGFLVVCGYVLLVGAAIGAIFLFEYLLEIFIDVLYAFLLAKTSSEVVAAFGTLAVLFATCVLCYGLHKLCSILQKRLQVAINLSKMKIVMITLFLKYIMTRQ